MRCRNCGHDNPEKNRFCGMCGNALAAQPAAEPEYAVASTPARQDVAPREQRLAPEVRREAAEPFERKPAITQPPRPAEVREPEPVSPVEAKKSDKWWTDEGETTVGGPSFLGLSSSESGGSGYSYLFQEEEERSHKGAWVLLLLLLALGGALYAKWQPIRDYVLTTAIMHSQQPKPVQQDNSSNQPATPASQPTTTVATSDPQSPPSITTDTTTNNTNNKDTANAKEALPDGDKAPGNEATASSKPAAAQAQPPKATAKQEPNAGDEASADEETPAPDEEKPASARKARAPSGNEGSELVNSGEKYLYGRGVARNCNQAVSYFNAAAAKQNPQAFSHLGALYATGECVPMDRATAYAWFRRAYAKEPSNHYFEQNLTMLWREMTPGEKQRAMGQ